MSDPRPIEQILDLARWAPSGDNTQPWRFEIIADDRVIVHGFDTRRHCVYDLDGAASQMALGALLETLRIVATGHGLRADVSRIAGFPDETPTFDIRLHPVPQLAASALIPVVAVRAVQRRPLRTTRLDKQAKAILEGCVAPAYRVVWFESFAERVRIASLLFRNAKIRLTIPEAFEVHKAVIEWGARYSEDRIPDQAVGADPLTMKVMRWLMQSWPRVDFCNTWLGGTLAPRLQLDVIPGLACAAHVGLLALKPPHSVDDYVAAGGAMQRIWLEATRLGLWMQPEMTPVIFGRYDREGRIFTSRLAARALANEVASELVKRFGQGDAEKLVFLGRIGEGAPPRARSIRLPLSRLAWTNAADNSCRENLQRPTADLPCDITG